MAYRKYTAKLLEENWGLKFQKVNLFKDSIIPVMEASWLLSETIEISKKLALTTEKSVCEQLISPILVDIQLKNPNINLFSGEKLNVDNKKKLNGEISFLLCNSSNFLEIESPILCITEAKIGLIDKGIPQAAAQMYGVRLFNEREGKPTPITYGAVTDGKTWRFLKLEGDILYADLEILYLDNLPLLLGTLQWLIDFYKTK